MDFQEEITELSKVLRLFWIVLFAAYACPFPCLYRGVKYLHEYSMFHKFFELPRN